MKARTNCIIFFFEFIWRKKNLLKCSRTTLHHKKAKNCLGLKAPCTPKANSNLGQYVIFFTELEHIYIQTFIVDTIRIQNKTCNLTFQSSVSFFLQFDYKYNICK